MTAGVALHTHTSSLAEELSAGCRAGLGSGFLLGLAGLPFGCGLLSLVALVPWLRWQSASPRVGSACISAFCLGGVAYGIPFAFVTVAPLPHAPLVYAFGIGALAGSLALVGGVLARVPGGRAGVLWMAPGLWAAAEGLRSLPLLGLPWLHLSHTLVDVPAVALGARWIGDLGLSAAVVAVNSGLVASWSGRTHRAALGAPAMATALAGALIVAATVVSGLPESLESPAAIPSIRIAAIQPDLSHDAEERRARHAEGLEQLITLSQRSAAEGADLVVWPETAYEREIPPEGDAFLGVIARSLGVPVLTGARRRTGPERTRNSVLLAEPSGTSRLVADKVHPLPVFERAPAGALGRWLADRGVWTGRHEEGGSLEVVELWIGAQRVRVGVLICADLGHPGLARELRRRGAQVLVHVSDESHLRGWSAQLHARVARLRAIELAVPVVRVANQGPSQWFDARGRVHAELGPGGPRSGTHAVRLAAPPETLPLESPVALAGLSLGAAGPVLAFAIGSRRSRTRIHKESSR